MSFKSKIRKLSRVSFFKTIILNFHYFGLHGVIHPKLIVSKNVVILGKKGMVNVKEGSKIFLGFGEIGFIDQKRERMVWDVSGIINFSGDAAFCPGCRIVCLKNGIIEFGKDFSCNARTKIICNKHIYFGNDCMISWDCTFIDTDFHRVLDLNNNRMNDDEDIFVQDHVWVCSETLVLKGAEIKQDSIIAARSIVTKCLSKKNSIYVNNDIVKEGINWDK